MLTAERPQARTERVHRTRFFLWTSIVLGIVVLWGFGPTYFLRPWITTRDLSLPIHVHAVVFIGWIVLFIVQAALVSSDRTRVHRRVGTVGLLLAAGVVLIGVVIPIVATQARVQAWRSLPDTAATFSFIASSNASSPILFGVFAAGGFAWRRRPEIHKRLMLLASIAIINAAVARTLDDFGWPIVLGPFGFIAPTGPFMRMSALTSAGFLNMWVFPFIGALVLYDIRTTRRVHPVTAIGGILIILFEPLLRLIAAGAAASA
jgi:hypothetical protein